MIDRVRLTAAAKVQLATLKKRTGIGHYNAICRHALCLSLSNDLALPDEDFNFIGGVEIDWRTFTGGYELLYLNLLVCRVESDGGTPNENEVKKACVSHLHRGLSYLASKTDEHLIETLISK